MNSRDSGKVLWLNCAFDFPRPESNAGSRGISEHRRNNGMRARRANTNGRCGKYGACSLNLAVAGQDGRSATRKKTDFRAGSASDEQQQYSTVRLKE